MYSVELVDKFTFKAPFTASISGPTGSGKSEIIKRILAENQTIIEPPPDRIVYCIPYKPPNEYDYLNNVSPRVQIIIGLPDLKIFNVNQNNLLILDDLMTEAEKSASILDLFVTQSHHSNISVILTKQNLFSKNTNSRTIALNSQYLILLKNPRDSQQISTLGTQMYPKKSRFLTEAYTDACKVKHGYLLIDLKQSTNDDHRIQKGVFYYQKRLIYKPAI